MALGVCLLFDQEADAALRQLWDRLERVGIGTLREHTHRRHRPHLSYSVLRAWDLPAVRDAIEELPPGPPITLTFLGVGTFPRGVGWLAPAVDEDVLARQVAVDEAVRKAGATVHERYVPGTWLAHSTVVPRIRTDQLGEFAAAAYAVLPLVAHVTGAALIDSGTGDVWALTHVP